MKKIPLTQGQEAVVDDGYWFDYLMQWKWQAWWNKDTQSYYARRTERKGSKPKVIWMHRVVAQTPVGMICDHIYHLTLDNRESELRNVTPSQSNMNRNIQKNNSTGIAGVHRRPKSGTYLALLNFEGKRVLKKTFKTIEEAIQARKEAEKKYFGEFSKK